MPDITLTRDAEYLIDALQSIENQLISELTKRLNEDTDISLDDMMPDAKHGCLVEKVIQNIGEDVEALEQARLRDEDIISSPNDAMTKVNMVYGGAHMAQADVDHIFTKIGEKALEIKRSIPAFNDALDIIEELGNEAEQEISTFINKTAQLINHVESIAFESMSVNTSNLALSITEPDAFIRSSIERAIRREIAYNIIDNDSIIAQKIIDELEDTYGYVFSSLDIKKHRPQLIDETRQKVVEQLYKMYNIEN